MKKKLNWYLNETLHRCTDVQLLLAHYVVLVFLDFRHGNNLSCDYMDESFKRESILIASTHISNDRNMAICNLEPRVFVPYCAYWLDKRTARQRELQSNQVKHTPRDYINELIICIMILVVV